MKTKILSGLICCLGIFSANAQTITAPVGQPLTITNAVDVTGGGIKILSGSTYMIGTRDVLSNAGTDNIFVGDKPTSNTGYNNLFVGSGSGTNNTTGSNNFFMGTSAGKNNTSGGFNVIMGADAGYDNNGTANIFIGAESGRFNTTGSNNFFLGTKAGWKNTIGLNNTFIGSDTGYDNVNGLDNVYIGSTSGRLNTSGKRGTFIGNYAGRYNLTGDDNTFIGFQSGAPSGSGALMNATAIGANAIASTSNTVILGNAATTITGQGLAAGISGLKFANITSSTSPGTGGAGKVLSVDATGNVILVALTGSGVGTTAVGGPVTENWKESDGYLYNNSTNGVVIKGTGLDGNSLIVKGGVLSKEVNVKIEGSEAWPDYVFKPNYKRMTLGEVEKFISINGHLPNVPSATEMAATGNNLGKTDVKLLEKVEELTLYLLDMKKANDAQAAELKALKQQVSKLRKK
jgi:trimeric autotransporter adhesin